MFQLLIVDDEVHVVERFSSTINWFEEGIEQVHKAFSGAEALSLLQQFSIDLVITDIRMPGMTGLELIAEIKSRWPKTKCILLSGYSDFAYAKEAILHETKDYLLKPVKEIELLHSIRRVKKELEQEWQQVLSHHRLQYTLKENLPILQGKLLDELLQGFRISEEALADKLVVLELPSFQSSSVSIMMVRLEDQFNQYDVFNLSLMEYAIGNMVTELFGDRFLSWFTKDVHDYLVFVMTPLHTTRLEEDPLWFERTATQLQSAVNHYLKGRISILISSWGTFPYELPAIYNRTVAAFRKWIGNEQELFLRVEDELTEPQIHTLEIMYEPPSLIHLLEAGRWSSTHEKLNQIFEQLQAKWPESEEHLLEVFFTVSSAFTYIAHKNRKLLSELVGDDYDKLLEGNPFRSVTQLREWSYRILERLKSDTDKETKDSRALIIHDIQEFIDRNLSEDISLQAIASCVHMHPVYVSKIYKLETGENLSDYVNRVRMNKAEYLLKNTRLKIFEIAAKVGYLRPHSFNQAFKRHIDMTPQEYRDKLTNHIE